MCGNKQRKLASAITKKQPRRAREAPGGRAIRHESLCDPLLPIASKLCTGPLLRALLLGASEDRKGHASMTECVWRAAGSYDLVWGLGLEQLGPESLH